MTQPRRFRLFDTLDLFLLYAVIALALAGGALYLLLSFLTGLWS